MTMLRDRLLAALLEDGRIQLVARDETVVRLQTDHGAGVVVLSADSPERFEAALRARVAAHRAGELHLVVAGGGDEIAAAMKRAAPFWQLGRRLGFHHLRDDETLVRVTGARLPLLAPAMERLPGAVPVPEERLVMLQAQGARLLEESVRLEGALRGFPVVTTVIGVACVALFLLGKLWADGSFNLALVRMGANHGQLVAQGDLWRLLASAFLHASWEHIAVNMIALASFGPILERLLGARRYLLLYGLSALGGGVASAFLRAEPILSVGASGAIWGLMTAGIGLALRPRGLLPPLAVAAMKKQVAVPLAINVLYSFLPGIDLLGHLGGGVIGFALIFSGVFTRGVHPVWTGAPPEPTRPNVTLTLGAALLSAAMMASVAMALNEGKPWRLSQPMTFTQVALGDTGLSVDLPEPLAGTRAVDKREDAVLFTFGTLSEHPLAIEVIVGGAAPDTDAAMKELRDAIEATDPPDHERIGKVSSVTVGGRPFVRASYRIQTLTMELFASSVAGKVMVVRVYALPEIPGPWRNLSEKIAASVRAL